MYTLDVGRSSIENQRNIFQQPSEKEAYKKGLRGEELDGDKGKHKK